MKGFKYTDDLLIEFNRRRNGTIQQYYTRYISKVLYNNSTSSLKKKLKKIIYNN